MTDGNFVLNEWTADKKTNSRNNNIRRSGKRERARERERERERRTVLRNKTRTGLFSLASSPPPALLRQQKFPRLPLTPTHITLSLSLSLTKSLLFLSVWVHINRGENPYSNSTKVHAGHRNLMKKRREASSLTLSSLSLAPFSRPQLSSLFSLPRKYASFSHCLSLSLHLPFFSG